MNEVDVKEWVSDIKETELILTELKGKVILDIKVVGKGTYSYDPYPLFDYIGTIRLLLDDGSTYYISLIEREYGELISLCMYKDISRKL